MKHYIGFLKNDLNKMLYFTSDKKPTRHTHWYFGKVLGPYRSEIEARDTMSVLKRGYGYRENPVRSNAVSTKEALALTKKVLSYAERIQRGYEAYKKNPGEIYHTRKFLKYMKELEKHKLGSCQYMVTLAKANEHVKAMSA